MTATPMLAVTNLSFRWKENDVLRNVTFSLAASRIAVILGANGSGKSTLLKVISKIYSPYRGDVAISGCSLSRLSAARVAQQIGYVPQSIDGVIPFTVFQFVTLSCYPLARTRLFPSLSQEAIRSKVFDALRDLSLEHVADRPLATLSGGERQRVLVAASIVHGPALLLLDEPTAHLDPNFAVELEEHLLRLHQQRGISILMVTHDLNSRMLAQADSVLGLRQGSLIWHGTPREVLTKESLHALYAHDFLFLTDSESGRMVMVPQ